MLLVELFDEFITTPLMEASKEDLKNVMNAVNRHLFAFTKLIEKEPESVSINALKKRIEGANSAMIDATKWIKANMVMAEGKSGFKNYTAIDAGIGTLDKVCDQLESFISALGGQKESPRRKQLHMKLQALLERLRDVCKGSDVIFSGKALATQKPQNKGFIGKLTGMFA